MAQTILDKVSAEDLRLSITTTADFSQYEKESDVLFIIDKKTKILTLDKLTQLLSEYRKSYLKWY